MAVYFPRGQVPLNDVEKKLVSDIQSAAKHSPYGVAFVTNQELTLSERQKLRDVDDSVELEIFHMERVAQILDKPSMHSVRKRYLDIDADKIPLAVTLTVNGAAHALSDPNALLDKLCEIEESGIRERAAKSRDNPSPIHFSGSSELTVRRTGSRGHKMWVSKVAGCGR